MDFFFLDWKLPAGGHKGLKVGNVLSAKETAKQIKARGRQVSNLSHKALNMAHLTSKIFVRICLFTVPMPFYSYFLIGTPLI